MDMTGYEHFAKAAALGSRSTLRHPVALDASLSSSAVGRLQVKLTDISERGCQCERSTRLIEGSFIMLSMNGYTPFGARVVWVGTTSVGLQFAAPLHPSILDHIVGMSKQNGAGR